MHERRKYHRYKILVDATLSWKKGAYEIHCVGYDLSQGGIGFICMEPLALNQEYVLQIKNIKYKFYGFLVSEGRVKEASKMKKYGIQFHKHLSLLELEQIVNAIQKLALKEKQSHFISINA